MVKRYMIYGRMSEVAESKDGQWVAWEDVRGMVEGATLETKSVECNCAEFADLKFSSVMLPEFWICPAHGYKRL